MRPALPSILPSPGIRFGPEFHGRLGRLAVRVASVRERREGAGRSALVGAGTEFVGFRPYRPGEDLRLLDWNLYARMRRPFVRVSHKESSEHWAVLLDASASMGVGAPGKLQKAAEIATAIAAIGRKERARVELFVSGSNEVFRLGKGADIGEWMRFLERVRASGRAGLGDLVREPGRFRRAGAVFFVGDLLDLDPRTALTLARRGRDLHCIQVLAPEELAPRSIGPVRLIDAETSEARGIDVDARAVAEYEQLLSKRLETWGRACARHRTFYRTWSSDAPFESVVLGLFEE